MHFPSYFYILPITTLIALTSLFLHRTHILIALLIFEATILTLIIIFPILSAPNIIFFTSLFLTLGACEASLGLSLLVLIARHFGSDLINSLSINNC